MTESVSDVLAARARAMPGMGPVLAWSVAGHVCVGLAALMGLASWMSRPVEPAPTVMTISLAGSTGPRTGGLTAIGGRTVQAPLPEQPVRRAERAPAPRAPEMALPSKSAVRPRPKVETSQNEAVGTTPTQGAEPVQGPARAQTLVRGQGFGLSTGGGGGTGVQLDVGNFCCPEYIEQMVRIIRDNWSPNQGVAGAVSMHFTILRTGTITPESIRLETGSGFLAHELAAKSALLKARLPPLPVAFREASLGVRMTFEYSR